MAKLNFHQSLLKSSVSHDPSEINPIHWFTVQVMFNITMFEKIHKKLLEKVVKQKETLRGYRLSGGTNMVLIWHWYLCNRYVLKPNQNADFSASFRCHAWAIVWNSDRLGTGTVLKVSIWHWYQKNVNTQPQKRVDVTALLTHLRLCCQVCSHKVWWEKPNTLIRLTLPPIRVTVREEILKPPPNNCNKKEKKE